MRLLVAMALVNAEKEAFGLLQNVPITVGK